MAQSDRLTGVIQLPSEQSVDNQPGISGGECRAVAAEDEELAGRNAGSIGEGEIDAAEAGSAQVQGIGSCVLELEEFQLATRCCPESGRVVHNLRDQQLAEILRGVERR